MPETPQSLAQGLVPASETVLYEAPIDKRVEVTLMNFANTHSSRVTLNVYKKVGASQTRISPPDFRFSSYYYAQEDGVITLEPSNQIIAECSVTDVVEYNINGVLFDL